MNHDQLRHHNFLETFRGSSLSSDLLGSAALSAKGDGNVDSATGNDGDRDGVADSASMREILGPTKVAGGTTGTF